MVIESQKVTINKTSEEVVEFASKVNNYQQLMPDTVTKFEITGDDSFRFALQGMPEFELKVIGSNVNSGVQLISASDKTPFKLNLNTNTAGNSTEGQFVFEGEFNAMMAMMIKKPISNFLGVLITKLSTI